MKRILITLFALGIGFTTQAAAFDWKTSATGKIYAAGSTTTLLSSGTAYIFDSSATTQQAVLTAFLANSTWTTGSLHSKAVSAGVVTATLGEAFTWGGSVGTYLDAFLAVVDGDNIYISPVVSGAALETGYTTLQFNAKLSSQAAAMESSTYSTAGWYAAASVPEPTSGLLLLLGMACLALKRKHD